ncbi:MAG: hypothetical protein ACWA5P_02800 [bacterium]
MAKKGFKLPPPTPLKQTAGNSFFQNLPMRPYVSLGSYANPQTYFGESSIGADVVSTIGNTFADSINAATSSQDQDSSVDTNVSGSNLTIDPTGKQEGQDTNVEGLEKGEDPKLEARIIKAKNEGNLKKAARLQGKQDRRKTRQVEGEKRIEERQGDRTQRVKNRQEGLTEDFKDKNFAGRMLSSIGNIFRSPTTMKEESPLGFVPGQQMGQPQAFSYDVPVQANMMGTAKPVFNQQTMGMAEAAFGNPAMRQASVGAPFQANAFYAALNDAKEKGAKTFEVGGKTFDVK